jgi:cyclin G-associated kinase
MFGDLLGTQGFDFSSTKKDSGPKTINAMRKEELAKDIDPDKMKVSILQCYNFTKCVYYG